jgi:hypothetical protein
MKRRMKRLGCLFLALAMSCGQSTVMAAEPSRESKPESAHMTEHSAVQEVTEESPYVITEGEMKGGAKEGTAKPANADNILPPQMGWSSWNCFRQNIDENKIREVGHALIDSGLNEYGYVYLNMDDCWQSSMRDENGRMQFDLTGFPSGPAFIKELNSLAGEESKHPLKVGLYSSSGNYTCEDLTASYGHEETDARTFAEWGVEYLKYDYCHVVDMDVDSGYITDAPEVDYITVAKANTPETVKYEAEDAKLEGNASKQDWYVTGLNKGGGSVTFEHIEVPEDGRYVLTIGFRKTYSKGKYAEVVVNSDVTYETNFAPTSGWSNTGRQQMYVDLKKGTNTIKIHNPIKGQKEDSIRRYTKMGNALKTATAQVAKENNTEEKPIFYSVCEHGRTQPWTWAQDFASSWRISGDINSNWDTIVSKYDQAAVLWNHQQAGAYNDPDMLEVGNGTLSEEENKSHFTLWCMLSAPLILGNDVRKFVKEDGSIDREACNGAYDIVTNQELIKLNQEWPLLQCKRVSQEKNVDILVKPLDNQEIAVCFFNRGTGTVSADYDLSQASKDDARAELPSTSVYAATDLWASDLHTDIVSNTLNSGEIPGHGVKVFRVRAAQAGESDKLTGFNCSSENLVSCGEIFDVSANVNNMGNTTMKDISVDLEVPEGFQAEKISTGEKEGLVFGEQSTYSWKVTAPADKTKGNVKIVLSYIYEGETEVQTKSFVKEVTVLPEPEDELNLGDMEWVSAKDGWKTQPARNKSIGGNAITIAGETYEKGVGTNSESEITVYLGGKNYRFTAAAGIDDEAIDDYNKTGAAYQPPQVTFELWADGVKVYDSGLVNMERPKVNIDVLIKNCRELLLKVTDGGNTNSYDHGDWADAKFVNVGEVAPGDITNIALEAAASSPAQTAANSGPEMANNDDVDVTKNGFAILEGQEESVRYLQYDWTEPKDIESLEFDTSYGALRGATECEILISKDGENFEKLSTWSGLTWEKAENVIETNRYFLTPDEKKKAQNITAMRVVLTKTKYEWGATVIMELRVLGKTSAGEEVVRHTVQMQSTSGGNVTAKSDNETVANGSSVEDGKGVIFTFTADPGFTCGKVLLNGQEAVISEDNTLHVEKLTEDITVSAEFEANVISGKIDLSRAEMSEKGVAVYLLNTAGEIVFQTQAEENGSYTFEKVPYGTYTVKIAENDGYTAEPVKVSLTGQNAIAATIRAEKKGQEDTEPNPDPDPNPNPDPKPDPDPKPEPKPDPKPEPDTNPGTEPNVKWTANAPKVKAKSLGYKTVQVKWDSVKDASGYVVYRKYQKENWKELKDLQSCSYRDTRAVTGRKYQYAVKAYRVIDGKRVYGELSKAVVGRAMPAAPKVTAKSAGKGKNKVTWKKVTGAQSYTVYRKGTGKKDKWKKLKTVKAGNRNFLDKKAKKGKTYYYAVKANRKVSKKSYSSIYGTSKKVKTKR